MASRAQKKRAKKQTQTNLFNSRLIGGILPSNKPSRAASFQDIPKREDLILKDDIFALQHFGLSYGICSILSEAKIRKVGDLVIKNEKDILELHGVGTARLKKIKEALLNARCSLQN